MENLSWETVFSNYLRKTEGATISPTLFGLLLITVALVTVAEILTKEIKSK